MMGWPVAWKCAVAWRCGEESQHPTWPQVRHNLRWTQREPILRHSSQPFALGTTSRIVSRCEHSSLIEVLLSLVSTNGVGFSFFGGCPAVSRLNPALYDAMCSRGHTLFRGKLEVIASKTRARPQECRSCRV